MAQLEVPEEDWICRFVAPEEWDDELREPSPSAFRASDRQLSVFHRQRVEDSGDTLQDLCIQQLSGFGEAHLTVAACIELGQGISQQFDPKVYWRPDYVQEEWARWKEAHAQVESSGGDRGFPRSYRVLLARNALCPRFPETA